MRDCPTGWRRQQPATGGFGTRLSGRSSASRHGAAFFSSLVPKLGASECKSRGRSSASRQGAGFGTPRSATRYEAKKGTRCFASSGSPRCGEKEIIISPGIIRHTDPNWHWRHRSVVWDRCPPKPPAEPSFRPWGCYVTHHYRSCIRWGRHSARQLRIQSFGRSLGSDQY